MRKKKSKTTDFRVNTDYLYQKNKKIFNGYKAEHSLRLELKNDIELVNEVLTAVGQSASETSLGISFEVEDTDSLKKLILESAIEDAQEKAEILSKAAGLELGEILSIDHSWKEVRFSSTEYKYDVNVLQSVAAPDIQPEDIRASDTVQVVYEIKEKDAKDI